MFWGGGMSCLIAPQGQGLFGAALASPRAVNPSAGPNVPTCLSRPWRGICDFQTVCREETVSANSLLSLRVTQLGQLGCDPWPPQPLPQLARVLPPQRGWVLPPQQGRVPALEQRFPDKAHPRSSDDVVLRFARHLQETNQMMRVLEII